MDDATNAHDDTGLPQGEPGEDGHSRNLRTILLLDICDSTGIVERLGDTATAQLFREHDRLVLRLQQAWRGRLIDRSDGLLLLFERPMDGLGFALDYGQGLAEIGKLRHIELKARAGLHVGELLTWRNSAESVRLGAKPLEVEGLAKPMAARLMSIARPGQVLMSAVAESLTHRAVRDMGERGLALVWKSHGRWRFKGMPETQEVFEVGEPGIAPLRRPIESAKAQRAVPLWRRPTAIVAEAALIAAVAVGGWFATRPPPAIAFNERDWVVVGDLRNLTGDTRLEDSLEQAFRISLEQSRHVNVLSDLKVRDTLGRMRLAPDTVVDRDIAAQIAQRDGARAVILPTVSEVGGRLRMSVEVVDPTTQTTVYAHAADGKGEASVLASIDAVTGALRSDLGEAMSAIQASSSPLPEVATDNLDALRAYALAQEATATRRWDEAQQLYKRAIQLDPEFALAYMGLVRILWSSIDYDAARPYLDKALALEASMPPKDRLYLRAWQAEVDPVGTPLEEWKMLATMYPDYFAGASNASWQLIVANRFKEALPFAMAAAVPQDPLRAFPIDHVGRIKLALGDPQAALAQFELSQKEGGDRPIRYTADALAVMGRYPEAWKVLDSLEPNPEVPSTLYSHMERISIALDQEMPARALKNADAAVADAERAVGSQGEHFALVAQSVRLYDDEATVDAAELERLAARARAHLEGPVASDRHTHVFRLLAIALVAQRAGHPELAEALLPEARPYVEALDKHMLEEMAQVVEANGLRMAGRSGEAIERLRTQLDGHELVQARVVLAQAYRDAGREKEAREQDAWLSRNRGRAYVEINVDQLLQAMNVAESRAATKRLAPSPSRPGA